MPSRHIQFTRLVEALGIEVAMVLVAFAGDAPTLYAPGQYRAGHILERVLGETGFLRLVAAFGGETICMPRLAVASEFRLGAVYRGMRDGLTTQQIADQIGISFRRVRQLEVAINGAGPLTVTARLGA